MNTQLDPENMTSTMTSMKDAIIATIARLGPGTSFVEIERGIIAAGLDPSGDQGISPDPLWDRNIILWAGVNAEFVDTFADLVNAQIIEASPTSTLVYLIDGKMLSFPVAKQPHHTYKSTRWIPVTLGPGPSWESR